MTCEETKAAIAVIISELKSILKECGAHDWQQRPCHPEEPEAQTWGSSDIIGRFEGQQKYGRIGMVYDSGNMRLVLGLRRHIEPLIKLIKEVCVLPVEE